MNLLGSANYDPATAASKATSALLAMTALDTTNLRVAVTVPAHGKLYFRMMCTLSGATTLPAILLGVMNGVTVIGRVSPQIFTGTQSAATQDATAFAEFVVTGLTPGAMSLDAAYAVQVIVASTNIKYGGPNNTTGANAWGAFVFEVWDPQPMPTAAPGAATGLLIAGANAASTFATLTVTGAFSVNGTNDVAQTGDSFARLGAPVGASHSADIAAVQADTDNIQTRLPAALVSGRIDASVGSNLDKTGYSLIQTFPSNFASLAITAGGAVTAGTVGDKTGYSLTQAFPANFASLGIGATGHVLNVDTLTTYTGNVVQTGDAFARIGAAGAGLTALGDTRIANLDAAVSTRLATAGYTAPDNTDVVAIKTTIGVAGAGLTALGDTRIAHLDADVSTRLATAGYTAPDNADIVSIKSTLGVAGAGLTALGDTRLAHLDVDVSTRLAAASYTAPPSAGSIWDVVLTGHLTAGTTGAALNAAGAAGDPWSTAIPGAYGAGTAGNLLGNRIDAAVSTRLATAGYTAPDNSDVAALVATVGVAGAGLTALGDARLGHLDADVSSRLATAGYTAPDNADIVAIRAKTDNLPPDPADASDVAAAFSIVNGAIASLNNISPAGVRAALGLALANLDAQLDALPTNAELATALVGPLAADVKKVNGTTLLGDGHTGTEWRPA